MTASVGLTELTVPHRSAPGRLGMSAADLTRRYQAYAVATDVCSGGAAALIGLNLRFGAHPRAGYVVIAALAPLLWLVVVASQRGYERHVLGTGLAEYRALANATLIFFVAIAVLSFTVKGELSRGFLVASLPQALLFSLLGRRQLRQWLFRRHQAREGLQRVLVVGRTDAVDHLVRHLQREPWQGMLPVGVCVTRGPADRGTGGEPGGLDPDRVLREVDAADVDVVAVASHPDLSGHVLRRLAWDLDERGVELVVSPGIVEVSGPRLSVRSVSGLMLVHLERPGMRGLRRGLRSLLDRAAGMALLLAVLPLMVLLAVAVKLSSPGPVLFRQTRVGVNGRPFPMVKFRSMVVDAEQRLADLLDDNEGNGMLFKLHHDPRVTRIGRVLRRYSLDELPQLWNVVCGDMSLVGPRPPLPDEVERYTDDARRRLRVKPGMTGLWQVSGRSDLSWEESLRLDLYYVDNSSFMLDVTILWRTIHAVFGRGGAY
jgi:exopolysaccharide biosynthesis polyprenyl glycosylphosphotransferase